MALKQLTRCSSFIHEWMMHDESIHANYLCTAYVPRHQQASDATNYVGVLKLVRCTITHWIRSSLRNVNMQLQLRNGGPEAHRVSPQTYPYIYRFKQFLRFCQENVPPSFIFLLLLNFISLSFKQWASIKIIVQIQELMCFANVTVMIF